MKFELIINENEEEKVTIVAKKDDPIFEQIRKLILGKDSFIIGYKNDEMKVINKEEI